ncbi:MAG: FimB/Mfa2 family fimbrial subunit [Bacteroidaceae bacterium]|nr:FimB/Mfa2 family fimbrial subunit [Bacteroidaceae bacterium]
MDCKRPHKYRALKQLLSIVCLLVMTSCLWVKDDLDECPYGFWIKLHYTYNLLDVDAAPKQVQDAYVYVYDTDGNYVKRIFATQEDLKANNYRVRVEGLPEGDYMFVVWSGIGNSQYAVAGDTQKKDDFRLSLVGADTNYAQELPALYHGVLDSIHYDDLYAQHDVELMKNTNQLVCLVVSVAENTEINPEDYTMEVIAANGVMDAHNRLVSENEIIYEPFEQDSVIFEDSEYGTLQGIKFNIMILRLMSDRDSRIILTRKSTGEKLFDISFPEYIGMIGSLYTNLGKPLSVQEYLDRQDFYTIVFYLSGDLDQLVQLQVNSWRLRANHHLKL